ncbi:MAG: V-type ATPase 116kDa subunit family protein [Trueperaceae bacterium]
MIAEMDQVLVVGRRSGAKDVLSALQSLGVVQVDDLQGVEAEDALRPLKLEGADLVAKETWDRLVARSTTLLDMLGLRADRQPRAEVGSDPAVLEAELGGIAEQVERLVAERAELRDELELSSTYLPLLRNLAPLQGPLDDARYLAGVAFLASEDDLAKFEPQLQEEFGSAYALARKPYAGESLVVAAVQRKDAGKFRTALARLGVAEVQLPERYAEYGVAKAAHVMEERARSQPTRLAAIDTELTQLAEQHGAKLASINRVALNMQDRFGRMEDMAEGRYSFALKGWVPSADAGNVTAALNRQFGSDVVVDTRAADAHHDVGVPVKFENPAWVRPFTGLLALFAPPKYGSFDPSWTLAVFFPLFFGLVVGDFGFGILFALLAWWMKRRGEADKELNLGPLGIIIPAGALKGISTVIFWCAAWSIAWGLMFGEGFGNFFERFPIGRPLFYTPLHHEVGYGIFQIPIFRVEVFAPILMLSLGFGVFQVLGGWLIRVIYGVKHNDKKHIFEGIGMFAGLLGIVLFAWGFLQGALSGGFMTVIAVLFVVFLICTVLAKMPLMLVELISNSGHILSYLRLFAVGLSAALVANLATDLGFALSGVLPVIGPILGILTGALVHLTAIALTIIGHTLQPLRLQYVEFFTKFGFYDESGRPYRPFKLLGGK